MRFLLWFVVTLFLASCGSGMDMGGSTSTGTATVNGTIHGRQVAASDAQSAIVPASVQGFSFQAGAVVISSAPGICATVGAGKQPRNWQTLVLGVAQQQNGTIGPPTSPGAFTIITGLSFDPQIAVAYFRATDANCADLGATADAVAISGTVALTSVSTTYTGSFDLTLDTGEHITGSFRAPGCPAIASVVQSAQGGGTAPACQ
jgi:hypothetical protein